MSSQVNSRMHVFKKVFFVLLVLDFAELISAVIALFPTFGQLAGYGQLMLGVTVAISAVIVAVLLFELWAKVFLIRSTSPAFSWTSGGKRYATVAKLLLLFNLFAVLFNLLSAGGEGATPFNQARLYLQILASAAEMIAAFCYLRTVKKLSMSAQ